MSKKKKTKKEKRVAPKNEIIWEGELNEEKLRLVKRYDECEVQEWLDYDPEDDPDDVDWAPEYPFAEIVSERSTKDAMGQLHWTETTDKYHLTQIIEELVKLIKPKSKKKTVKKKATKK